MNEAVMHSILMLLGIQDQLITEGLELGEMKGLVHEMEDGSHIIVHVRWAPPKNDEEEAN